MSNIRTFTTSEIQNLLSRTTVGAESLFNQFLTPRTESNYPPYNIVAVDENKYLVFVAVAGFTREDLTVSVDNGELLVEGKSEGLSRYFYEDDTTDSTDKETKFPAVVHQGIGTRNFTRRFKLTEYVVVKSVKLVDGLLIVKLERELPEALKPRTIEIG